MYLDPPKGAFWRFFLYAKTTNKHPLEGAGMYVTRTSSFAGLCITSLFADYFTYHILYPEVPLGTLGLTWLTLKELASRRHFESKLIKKSQALPADG